MFVKSCVFALYALLCVNNLQTCKGDDEVPLVQVKQGLIKGIKDKSIDGKEFYSYMSIPFAESPEGKLRFRDPVALKSWDGEMDGSKMPVSCLQGFFAESDIKAGRPITISGREDCLHLNVFIPASNELEKKKKLPVMVYIHGGGFLVGNTQEYPPYVLMNEDIVLVSIQYRLGIFGFLSTEDSVMPGNMGLKDQQLALKWVKENIESFGGDSDRITIFGESAGAASVHYQILSPGSKGLFNRAIIQSGTSLCPWASNKNHRKFAIETGHEFNCSIDLGAEKYLECMQNVNPYYLAIAAEQINILGLYPSYVLPRVDGKFIDEAPEILMKKRKYNKVDIIAGITRDEGGIDLMFEYMIPKRKENINFEKLGPMSLYFEDEESPMDLTKQVYQYYLKREDVVPTEDDWLEIVEMCSDRMFRVPHDIVSNIFASDPDVKLYLYQLDYFGNLSVTSAFPGYDRRNVITHGDDLVYLFSGGFMFPNKMENVDDLRVRKIFVGSWINFAKTGNPTPSGSDYVWREATSESFKYLSLTRSPVMKEDYFQKERKFWSSLKTTQNLLLKKTLKEEL